MLLEVSYVEPDYLRPWQKSPQGSCTGSGFAISGRRILTNRHVVQDATDVRLRKHGDARRWRARTVAEGPDVDLAVLEVFSDEADPDGSDEVESFWEGVKAVEWDLGGAPELQSSVNVVGYPTGGRTICVTEGVVSRVDCRNYRLKTASAAPGHILVIQIDAAINPGNSGGPCFDPRGKVVGVAFQGMEGSDAQNVGYIIPADTVLNFLDAIRHGDDDKDGNGNAQVVVAGAGGRKRYGGVQEVPFKWTNLQSRALRRLLGMSKKTSGVVVTRVSPLARSRHDEGSGDDREEDFLRENDVITRIDGRALGDDYTVALREGELMNADFLITGKRVGQPTTFDVVRDGAERTVTSVLRPLPSNVPREHKMDSFPGWLVVGGLLFVPLTCPLLVYPSSEELESSGYLKIYDHIDAEVHKFRAEEGTESVVLIDILACDANFGYYFRSSWRVLNTLNGKKIRNMAHLYNMYNDACDKVKEKDPGEGTIVDVDVDKSEDVEEAREDGGAEDDEEKKAKKKAEKKAATPVADMPDAAASLHAEIDAVAGDDFLVFRFRDRSRIVLETSDCMSSEAEVLGQHGIPSMVSANVVEMAKAEAERGVVAVEVEGESEGDDAEGKGANEVEKKEVAPSGGSGGETESSADADR